ncbi:hypothetical protein MHM84_13370 [Halomonas sp. McH1-25]|uniref:hypothetical protein n=1 Tax=unclassified Halomonas TaxID=2609666 RepID=UPI001EF54B41|nr:MULTISPECIES: hypothetical protein [unclassified Halomonas]MCG7600775.1 hypothetical protein [Halomonas sp. McH1-25]MCP1342740.1 hypothetical protein [Halomonas sp. FL8]MCP1361045.1 hypothetical protein [Halomonas sp. BBD45]MCP1364280.1 hypothetical protein [Halomonas sp. BBD48]
MDTAVTFASLADALVCPTQPSTPANLTLDPALAQRLSNAKLRLDRLEQDRASRDLSALMAARVEFALASRALADHLIAQQSLTAPSRDRSDSLFA